MNLNLEGKVAIVTGAARGIGKATALTLCKEGAKVVIDDIDLEEAKKAEEEAKSLGAQAVAIEADVTKMNEVRQMVKETIDKFGRIDILVNNVGILYINGQLVENRIFAETTENDWPALVNVTLGGVLNCSKAVLDTMLSQKSGSIINVSSDAATGPQIERISVYGAGKGGIIAFTKSLACELGPSGIRVNCVSPGSIRTTRISLIEAGGEGRPEVLKFFQDREAALKRMPLRRFGAPEEVANLVAFLASDAASYITGQTLSINGGRFMR